MSTNVIPPAKIGWPAVVIDTGVASLSVALTEDAAVARPAVRLGIKGRAEDGWYPLSTVRIAK